MNKMCLTPTCYRLGLVVLLFSFLLGGCAGETRYDKKTLMYSLGKGDKVTADYSMRKGDGTKTYNANPKEKLTAEYIYKKGGRTAPDTKSIHSTGGYQTASDQSGDASSKSGDAGDMVMVLEVDDILFDFDKWVIKRDFVPELDKWVEYFQNNPEITADIYGHADSTGPTEYNQKLSERRAQAVINYMAKKGVDASRLTARGFGETQPAAPNTTQQGRQQNRRVELSY